MLHANLDKYLAVAAVPELVAHFWTLVKQGEPDACWEWQGSLRRGYGNWWVNAPKVAVLTHRLSYVIAHGPFDPNLMVCHACDNRRCVNPHHLWLGTNLDNIEDMINKGRKQAKSQRRKKRVFKVPR